MLTSLIFLAGGAVVGFLWGRPSETRKRCGARLDKKVLDMYGDPKHVIEGVLRCKELVDPRCLGGNCAKHCRDPKRCNGKCLEG